MMWSHGVTFFCRNTLVCDTQEEAKRLAFGTERHKVGSCKTQQSSSQVLCSNDFLEGLVTRDSEWQQQTSSTCAKVVSMDGTLISKGGVMTGGMSRNLESRAQRWDEKATGSLKEVPFRMTLRLLTLCCCA